MGLYSQGARRELDTIRDVRNDFAHELHIGFDMPSVKDRCANLVLWEKVKLSLGKADDYATSKKLIMKIGTNIGIGDQEIPLVTAARPEFPHDRYQAACRFYIAVFSVFINTGGRPTRPII
jgi:hypothetical protein